MKGTMGMDRHLGVRLSWTRLLDATLAVAGCILLGSIALLLL